MGSNPSRLDELSKEYWETRLANEPLLATALGYRQYDGRLSDNTPEGRRRTLEQYESLLARSMEIPDAPLSEGEKLTRAALLVDIKSVIDYASCKLDDWMVDPLQGSQVEFMNVESYQPVSTPSDGMAMVERWNAMGRFLQQQIVNVRAAIAEGRVAVRPGVEKVIEEVKDQVTKPDSEWSLLRPLTTAHADWTQGERQDFSDGLALAVKDSVRPAYVALGKFLESELLPRARPQNLPGIMHIPGGADAYLKLIDVHTSLQLKPEELHQTGLSEVARINRAMEDLGERLFGTRDRKEVLTRLRTDPALYFSNRDEIAAKAEQALVRANDAISRWFGRLPETKCEVVRMEEHEEKFSTIAYYRPPAADGSRPGRYYINTSAPETRPRYEAEVLAYHESVPGHHLQLAIAQELKDIPEFRRNSGVTAFIEGWGLYSERLADEMGLYSSDLDRMGVLSYDAWRACRLVVDTGMHAMGWTRQQAIDFMIENTALAENNIVNEVDRYITWPGQALAYKTGQLEMIGLREESKKRLGTSFDIKKFHDVLLGSGAVPLKVLRQMIKSYA